MAEQMDLSDAMLQADADETAETWTTNEEIRRGLRDDIYRLAIAIRDAATAAERERCALELEAWAQDRWKAEVQHRPVQNIYRRTLDETWRQVERDGPTALRGGDHE